MKKNSRIYVAGHSGMVGSAIKKELERQKYTNIITAQRADLDLLNYERVKEFFECKKPEFVFFAAASVGGIQANMDNPGSFLYENLQLQNNLIHLSYLHNVEKFCFFGSSCIYPKESPQPMKEEYLLSGKLEPSNEGYAIAKIAGLKLCENYNQQYGFNTISIMPCNLYGSNDSFDLKHCHVLSALVKKISDAKEKNAKEITLWGSGIAKREFLNVDDLSWMTIELMNNYNSHKFINIGSGNDISIRNLAELIANQINFEGNILWDRTKPDGMLNKCLDVSNMKSLDLTPKISLELGLKNMIENYNKNKGL